MKLIKLFLIMPVFLIICSCAEKETGDTQPRPVSLQEGAYRAVLTVEAQDGVLEIPFNISLAQTVQGSWRGEIINADEKIIAKDVEVSGNLITIDLPVFDSVIEAEIKGDVLEGKWYDNGRDEQNATSFKAYHGVADRFTEADETPAADVTGKWQVTMNPDSTRASDIMGIFKQSGNHLTGTFLTPTGDYRFLEGKVTGNKIMLSCFDGAHSFLFKAEVSTEGNLENGIFNTGSARSTAWRAVRNENFSLPDPETLTFIREGYDKLEFTFGDLEGNPVSLTDEKYKDKVIIVQIFGSWCPNCMDETRFLASLYERYHDQGLEIIALAFEKKEGQEAVEAIKKYKKDLNANYDFLLAGPADKTAAVRKLPMLNRIISYPTAVFIDHTGEIRKIYTGFSGPGTGEKYTQFVTETEQFVRNLLKKQRS